MAKRVTFFGSVTSTDAVVGDRRLQLGPRVVLAQPEDLRASGSGCTSASR